MFPTDLSRLAEQVLVACRTAGYRLATAESCTGGLIAGCLTSIAGSSDVLDRGFVTYSNAAKSDLLGVSATLITDQGAVSAAVAQAMAQGALRHSQADLSIAVTGIAGPGGGSATKPVGLVFLACALGDTCGVERYVFPGDRDAVRLAAVTKGLQMILQRLAVS